MLTRFHTKDGDRGINVVTSCKQLRMNFSLKHESLMNVHRLKGGDEGINTVDNFIHETNLARRRRRGQGLDYCITHFRRTNAKGIACFTSMNI